MSDLLEQNLRDVLSERAAQIDPAASARLRAIDYRPRRRRRPTLPALGVLGVSVTAAVVAVVTLASGAAPAFAGWSPTPTPPAAGQLAAAEQACSANLGTPLLTDTRGPYTASIYADATSSHTCLDGGSTMSIASSNSGSSQGDVLAGQVQLTGSGMKNSSGQALTLVDGRIGAGVTSVRIDRSDGSSVQATVSSGWYLAWWPGTVQATTADVTTTTGTVTQHFPSAPQGPASAGCPAGSHCSSGYSFGSARAGSTGKAQMTVRSGASQ